MDIIMIPGLWLDGSSWDEVVPHLEAAGHHPHALTLPGMESKDADRRGISLREHVDAVVRVIDSVGVGERVVLVAHSAGCAIAHAAVDARPGRVTRAIYIGGFPTGDGHTVASGFMEEGADVPLPDWSEFEDEDLVDLDDRARAAFRQRAIPSPAGVTRSQQQLSDERRYNVPVTAVATEYTTDMLRSWIEQDMAPVREFSRIREVEYVDLPTGHWPQFTRPKDLAQVILVSVERA
ncbi:MAG TPA: alpha/beta hydrolase [Jiangellaceae bacterium]|nr:alpha/beta hydrolase [Jiangellaceae bacterium]